MLHLISEILPTLSRIAPILGHLLATATAPAQLKIITFIADEIGIKETDVAQLEKTIAANQDLTDKIKSIENDLSTKCLEHFL